MTPVAFTLLKTIDRITLCARVEISIAQTDAGPTVTLNPQMYDHYRDAYGPNAVFPRMNDSRILAAVKGARYALEHLPSPVEAKGCLVIIEKIVDSPVDTTDGAIAYAACYAVWKALEVEGTTAPEITPSRQVVFP